MLTGQEILNLVDTGLIVINPFDPNKINPNSYNLTLNNKLLVYDLQDGEVLDSKKPNLTKEIIIPEEGYVLQPGVLYLGTTNESTYCKDLIPQLDGRSSTGRLGLCVHITAGFGDIGFSGKWTLEITVVHPLKIYPNMEVCQISFHMPDGTTNIKYNGKYQGQDDVTPSRIYKDFKQPE